MIKFNAIDTIFDLISGKKRTETHTLTFHACDEDSIFVRLSDDEAVSLIQAYCTAVHVLKSIEAINEERSQEATNILAIISHSRDLIVDIARKIDRNHPAFASVAEALERSLEVKL